MSTIRSVYSEEPTFPATDQHPDAVRYKVGGYFVDAIGGEPTGAEIAIALGTDPVTLIDAQLEAIDDETRAAMRGLREILLGTLTWATAAKQQYPDLPAIPMNQGIVNLAALEQAAAALRAQRKAITG